jgi:4-diphosphocytidyl-2-C-methyl-D-erythritol kinase
LANEPVRDWGNRISNDFEPGAFARHPQVGALLDGLRKAGAQYVQMTGSGSTVFGLFAEETLARQASQAVQANYCGPLAAG